MAVIQLLLDHVLYHWSFPFLISLISAIIIRFLIPKFARPSSSTSHRLIIASPPALPLIGHLHLLRRGTLPVCFRNLSSRYGPVMRILIGPTPFIVITDASIAYKILNDVNFADKYEVGPTEKNIYEKGTGFATGPYGSYWRFMKSLCTTKLLAGRQLAQFDHLREDEIKKLLKAIKEKAENREACDLNVELHDMTNRLIFRMTMRNKFERFQKETAEIRRLVEEILRLCSKLSPNEVHGFLRKFDLFGIQKKRRAALVRYDCVMEEILRVYEESMGAETENEGEVEDLIFILLQTWKDPDAQVKITRAQIKYFLLDLFFASIDATSGAAQQVMVTLMKHPEIMQKVREEIERVVVEGGCDEVRRLVKESDVPKLPYLQAVVLESLRLNGPAVMINRRCISDCDIMSGRFHIRAGDRILINNYAISRDPEVWESPESFSPERFLMCSDNNYEGKVEVRRQEARFLAFGSGKRKCVGMGHAMLVLHGTVGALVQCFDWTLLHDDDNALGVPVNKGYAGSMAPPLICHPTPRLIHPHF